MSSRPQFDPHYVVTNGDMSGDITSEVTIIKKLSMISYEVKWTGTSPVGQMVVEVSNDYTPNAAGQELNPGTWNALPLSAPAGVTGNSDSGFIDIFALSGYAIRIRYERGSGTGTMNIIASGKVA